MFNLFPPPSPPLFLVPTLIVADDIRLYLFGRRGQRFSSPKVARISRLWTYILNAFLQNHSKIIIMQYVPGYRFYPGRGDVVMYYEQVDKKQFPPYE